MLSRVLVIHKKIQHFKKAAFKILELLFSEFGFYLTVTKSCLRVQKKELNDFTIQSRQ